ncbi:hydantoinase B/oxoprolinase family protein [Streptomyces sp. NPDC048278]|uniref:hydantoinase B/oxoprolinase family protein n=1 Tax=Streptomyces sp. NPDC048278 TaxID=3155809 RepID=UPI00344038A0
MTTVDPITFEVIRHRLWAINDDQARMASSLSGTPIVHEGYDFNAALTTGDGGGLFVGAYVMHHATGIDDFVRRVIEEWGPDGVHEGDVFFTNDPWWGALHPNDAVLAMPVFADGRLVTWSGIVMHENDVGGSVPGSMVSTARDQFSEGPLIPGVKIGEGFALRRDIENIWLRNTRTPHLNKLNLRARLAALLLTHRRVGELVDRYGHDTLVAVEQQITEHVERVVRTRLREIPDGTWTARTYHDHDGTTPTLYPVVCRIDKRGESLTVDMTGTAGQAAGPVNCARPALEGAVLGVVLMELCHDLPWSVAALRRIVTIVTEPGTLVDALPPAATSMASIMATLTAQDAVVHAMGQMMLCSPRHRAEAQATWSPGMMGCSFVTPPAGPGREPAFAILANHFGGGGGARVHGDGIDTAGPFHSTKARLPSIEVLESRGQVLHHYRRELRDSGGPGRYRGGVGIEYAVSAHKTGRPSTVSTMSSGVMVPGGRGLAGGMPGGPAGTTILRGTDIRAQLAAGRLPSGTEDLTAERTDVQLPKQHSPITVDDVLVGRVPGGAGYGDPLRRDPARVAVDVAESLVSRDTARRIYGVVLDERGEVDAAATAELRRERAAGRRPSPVVPATAEGETRFAVADVVEVVAVAGAGSVLRCTLCHTRLGARTDSYAAGAQVREVDWAAAGPYGGGFHPDYVLRELSCPGCGTALSYEVQHRDDPVPTGSHLHGEEP